MLPPSLILKMEAACPETSASAYETIQCHSPEGNPHHENLKTYKNVILIEV
jgi:hypothetical protein